ncbi:MAG: glutathione S-transferase family protein [Caulobacteraceae bacterium]|nr:glutathione S-transferase family protein [Caulobacteraceae bacterium]
MGDEFILHHYDTSPFSEKVRLAFGLKGLAWRSVIQPNVMPKPDLVPLTGGYRRIPVMQVGADVLCDTQVILAEIERRAPAPSLGGGLGFATNWWADRLFFQATVAIIFGAIGHLTPEAFIKDREALSGQRFNIEAMKAAAGPMRGQWRAQAAWIEAELGRTGAPWLGGATASLADIAAYMNLWFMKSGLPSALPELLAGLDRTAAWQARVAAIGHGVRTELSPAEALAVARAAEPSIQVAHDPADPLGLAPDAAVFVMADDYGRDRVTGALVAANPERIVIARQDEALGRLHLHFPRAGYAAGPA